MAHRRNNIKKLICLIILIPLGVFGNCGSREQPANNTETTAAVQKKISAAQAKAMMEEGKPYTLLDVRTVEEFNGGRIKGAILIPVDELGARAERELTEKDLPILVYCRSGVRSANAARILADLGYTNIHDLGGIINWPYETVNE